ncbi:MAG: metal ABC transporter permease [Aestuariivirga sp.]
MAGLSVVAGLLLSASANTISGPSVVLAAGLLFVLTLALPQTN